MLDKQEVDFEFWLIVAGLGYRGLVAEKLVKLMDLTNEIGRWPDESAPKMVGKLWIESL